MSRPLGSTLWKSIDFERAHMLQGVFKAGQLLAGDADQVKGHPVEDRLAPFINPSILARNSGSRAGSAVWLATRAVAIEKPAIPHRRASGPQLRPATFPLASRAVGDLHRAIGELRAENIGTTGVRTQEGDLGLQRAQIFHHLDIGRLVGMRDGG